MKHKICILALCGWFIGCNDDLPKYGLVSKLRVIALKTTTPEISPGDSIPSVEALALDPDGGGRAISYEWVGCLEMASTSSSRYECTGAADRVVLGTGSSSTAGVVTIPSTVLDSVSATRAYNGISYIVAVTVTAGSESVKAFKRIVISSSSKTAKNSNPSVTSLSRNGTALNATDVFVAGDFTMAATLAAGSAESYTYLDAQGSAKTAAEDILLTWFYTEGKMDNSRTFGGDLDNVWKISNAKARSTVTLVVVANDGRGGVSWFRSDLN